MRLWPFNRRPGPVDRTGPATAYPNRSGAFGPEALSEVQPRRNNGRPHYWAIEPTMEYQRAPLLTLGQQYRFPGRAG
ncbi:hypothetical protein U2F26_29745 [Micromonospora sp. 4G57]|uniref:Uncharacterized protein n=1 Tax=Micromonospora sicca TaxID=2202420 RepID=A0ABU5JIC2_9ACTN|nr:MULTISPECIES: hypothetical protein [unclassified Micromonospora]MDZ5446862.1 hypothetical protein [Micromonospora sp. 4G57]MDZ5492373.1 hypothetical protein [Micromonospora sp. 4G53]